MIQDAVKIVTNRRRSGSVKQLETWKTRVSLFLRGSIAQLQQRWVNWDIWMNTMRYLIHMNRKKSLISMIQSKGWILKCTGIYCLLWFWFYFAMKNQRFQNQSTHKELERKRLSWKLIILSIFMGLISVLRQFLKGALNMPHIIIVNYLSQISFWEVMKLFVIWYH